MFSERVDGHITMLQRIVALLRDLVLGVTITLTCIIVYFGGDPSKLNALDWAKLVGAASLIVVGPIISFLVYKLVVFITNPLLLFILSIPFSFMPLERDFGPWEELIESVFRRNDEKFKEAYSALKEKSKSKFVPKFQLALIKGVYWFMKIRRMAEPYLFALMILLVAILVFRRTILVYIP